MHEEAIAGPDVRHTAWWRTGKQLRTAKRVARHRKKHSTLLNSYNNKQHINSDIASKVVATLATAMP